MLFSAVQVTLYTLRSPCLVDGQGPSSWKLVHNTMIGFTIATLAQVFYHPIIYLSQKGSIRWRSSCREKGCSWEKRVGRGDGDDDGGKGSMIRALPFVQSCGLKAITCRHWPRVYTHLWIVIGRAALSACYCCLPLDFPLSKHHLLVPATIAFLHLIVIVVIIIIKSLSLRSWPNPCVIN